jgi:phage terminase small subunit
MPALPNAKQELFCQNYVKGMSQAEAYEKAGYAPNRCNASRLMKTNENIPARIVELFDETMPEVKWDRENVNKQYTELLYKLKRANKLEAAAKVVDSISRVNGLIITRHETGKAGEFEGLTDYELLELIAEPLGDSRADDSE